MIDSKYHLRASSKCLFTTYATTKKKHVDKFVIPIKQRLQHDKG